jgi:hypothetical protein
VEKSFELADEGVGAEWTTKEGVGTEVLDDIISEGGVEHATPVGAGPVAGPGGEVEER